MSKKLLAAALAAAFLATGGAVKAADSLVLNNDGTWTVKSNTPGTDTIWNTVTNVTAGTDDPGVTGWAAGIVNDTLTDDKFLDITAVSAGKSGEFSGVLSTIGNSKGVTVNVGAADGSAAINLTVGSIAVTSADPTTQIGRVNVRPNSSLTTTGGTVTGTGTANQSSILSVFGTFTNLAGTGANANAALVVTGTLSTGAGAADAKIVNQGTVTFAGADPLAADARDGVLSLVNGGEYVNEKNTTFGSDGTLTIGAGKFTNKSQTLINGDAIAVATVTNAGTGSIVNEDGGYMAIGRYVDYGTGGGTIDNSATIGDFAASTDGKAGLHLDMTAANSANILTDLVKGGTGTNRGNVGDTILTSSVATVAPTAIAATGGNVYLGNAFNQTEVFNLGNDGAGTPTDFSVNVGGADLIVDRIATTGNDAGVLTDAALTAKDIYVNQAGVYEGVITANGANNNGKVTLADNVYVGSSAAGTGIINAVSIDAQGDSAAKLGATVKNVNVASGKVFGNLATGTPNGLDLRNGGTLTGNGDIDNSGGAVMTVDNTTVYQGDTKKIYNTARNNADGINRDGQINVVGTPANDANLSTAFNNLAAAIDVSQAPDPNNVGVSLGGGYGRIDVAAGNLSNVNIDWNTATDGTLNLASAGTSNSFSGSADLGAGGVNYGTPNNGSTYTINTGSEIYAGLHTFNTTATNSGLVDGAVTVGAGVPVTNTATGGIAVGVDGTGTPEALTFTNAGSSIVNTGDIELGSDAVVVNNLGNHIINGANGVDGTITATDLAAGQWTSLATAINDTTAAGIGQIILEGDLQGDSFDLSNAQGGDIYLNGVRNGGNVDGGLSNVNQDLSGAGHTMGNISGGTVTVSGTGGGTVGVLTARNGNVSVDVSNERIGGSSATNGDVLVTGSGNTFATTTPGSTGAVVAGARDGNNNRTDGSVLVSGSGNMFTGIVIARDASGNGQKGDLIVTGADNAFTNNIRVTNQVLTSDRNGFGTYFGSGAGGAGASAIDAGGIDGLGDDGIVVASGTNAIFGGVDLGSGTNRTDLRTEANGTITIAAGGLDNSGSDIDLLATGSSLNFTAVNGGNTSIIYDSTATTGTIQLAGGTDIHVDPRVAQNLNDNDSRFMIMSSALQGTTLNGVSVLDPNDPTGYSAAFQSYLDWESEITAGQRLIYETDNAGNLVYRYERVDLTDMNDVRDANAQVALRMGLDPNMISDSAAYTQALFTNHDVPGGQIIGADLNGNGFSYDGLVNLANGQDPTGVYGRDLMVADIIRAAGGLDAIWDLKENHDMAYSVEQWKNGQDWAGALNAAMDTARNFSRSITNRAYNIGHLLNQVEYDECGNVINSCGGFKNRIWAGYTAQWDKQSSRSWYNGYNYDAHGFNVGYDHVTSSGLGFGAAFGYSKGDFKNAGSWGDNKSKLHNYSWGLFASYNHASGLFATVSGSYTYTRYKMNNGFIGGSEANNIHIGSNYGSQSDRASYHGDTWSVGGQIGYDIRPLAGLTITPTVGLYHYYGSTNRFNSTYRNGMKYSGRTLELPVEVTAKYDIEVGCDSTLSLMANAGYTYNFNNKGTRIHGFNLGDTLNAASGDSRLVRPGRSSWNVGGGIQYRYKNVDFGANYEYYGRNDFRSHNLNVNVGYSF